MAEVIYRRPNRRKCYWLFRDKDCLKGYNCSGRCPEYLSEAQARLLSKVKARRQLEAVLARGV